MTTAGYGGFNRRGFSLTSRGHHTLTATFTDTTGTASASSDIEILDVGGRGEIRNVVIMLGDGERRARQDRQAVRPGIPRDRGRLPRA